MAHGNSGTANGMAGPIKESRRLRITIGHRRRTIERHREAIRRLESEVESLEEQLTLVVKAESAVASA